MNCISILYFCSDLHSLGQLSLKKSWNPDREHRGGLQKWPEAHAAAGGDLGRDAAQAGQGQDALPQDRQRQQGMSIHRIIIDQNSTSFNEI